MLNPFKSPGFPEIPRQCLRKPRIDLGLLWRWLWSPRTWRRHKQWVGWGGIGYPNMDGLPCGGFFKMVDPPNHINHGSFHPKIVEFWMMGTGTPLRKPRSTYRELMDRNLWCFRLTFWLVPALFLQISAHKEIFNRFWSHIYMFTNQQPWSSNIAMENPIGILAMRFLDLLLGSFCLQSGDLNKCQAHSWGLRWKSCRTTTKVNDTHKRQKPSKTRILQRFAGPSVLCVYIPLGLILCILQYCKGAQPP